MKLVGSVPRMRRRNENGERGKSHNEAPLYK
jgi:hypothetical protein